MISEVKQNAQSGSEVDSIAGRLLKVVPALRSHELRMSFVRELIVGSSTGELKAALDSIWMASESGQPAARDVMLAIVGLMVDPEMRRILAGLGAGFLVQRESRVASAKAKELPGGNDERKVPDYGSGRTLTLGERKSLARRPDRTFLQKLLLDPNPSVIRNLLANPRLTEDDVVSLAARRPLSEQLLEELLRHPKWSTRRRVRMAIVLNPSCPTAIGFAMVYSLIRSELRCLAQSTEVSQQLRVLASSRLQLTSRKRKPVE